MHTKNIIIRYLDIIKLFWAHCFDTFARSDFRRFVAAHGRLWLAITRLPDFPDRADYRQIKLFVNTRCLPPVIGERLVDLHDEYHERRAGQC